MHSESTEIADLDLSTVDAIVEEIGRGAESVIPILQAIQEHYRYLPEAALERVCEISDITPAQITGVATFYSQFRHRPMGSHLISLCDGTACHVKGSIPIYDAICKHLKIPDDDDTDPEGVFTIQKPTKPVIKTQVATNFSVSVLPFAIIRVMVINTNAASKNTNCGNSPKICKVCIDESDGEISTG